MTPALYPVSCNGRRVPTKTIWVPIWHNFLFCKSEEEWRVHKPLTKETMTHLRIFTTGTVLVCLGATTVGENSPRARLSGLREDGELRASHVSWGCDTTKASLLPPCSLCGTRLSGHMSGVLPARAPGGPMAAKVSTREATGCVVSEALGRSQDGLLT